MGGLDILFNNAGIAGGDWDRTIAINLSGVYYGLYHGAPFLAERGGGTIISTASVAGLVGLTGVGRYGCPIVPTNEPLSPGAGAYVAAKHGVSGLTRQYAISFGKRNVRVNAVAPGYIETPMTAGIRDNEAGTRFLESLHPLGRLGQAVEVAAAVAFLASDDASFHFGGGIAGGRRLHGALKRSKTAFLLTGFRRSRSPRPARAPQARFRPLPQASPRRTVPQSLS